MAQERCIRRTAQFGRLWEPNEVRTVTKFDDEGRPVFSQHFRPVEDDEKVDIGDLYDPELAADTKRASAMRDKTTAIRSALERLDVNNDSHWTAQGLPAVQQVHLMTDFEVSRAEIQAAFPEFSREFAIAGQKVEAATKARSSS